MLPLETPLSVAVIATTEQSASQLTRRLKTCGPLLRPYPLAAQTSRKLRELGPAVVVLKMESASLSTLEELVGETQTFSCALVMLTSQASPAANHLAERLRAQAHLVEPVSAQSFLAAIILAAAQAQEYRQLQERIIHLRELVETFKTVERAKEVLIRRFGFTENEAHRRLQLESRRRNQKLFATARRVVRIDRVLSRQQKVTER